MTNQESILQILKETGALTEGHFLLTSGRHSDRYIQCAMVFQYPKWSQKLTQLLANKFKNDKIDVVIGPAIGGIILSYEMGRCLGVKSIFAERVDGTMVLRRGFQIPKGSKILIVEDVVTTGGSIKEIISLVKNSGAEVAGIAALVDRSNGIVDFQTKFETVISLKIQSYEPENCPICKTGTPLIKPGSRIFNKLESSEL